MAAKAPFRQTFRDQFATASNRQQRSACANGPGTQISRRRKAGIAPGERSIMPTFTSLSPAASVIRAGAIRLLVDSSLELEHDRRSDREQDHASDQGDHGRAYLNGTARRHERGYSNCETAQPDVIEDGRPRCARPTVRDTRGGSFGLLLHVRFYPTNTSPACEGDGRDQRRGTRRAMSGAFRNLSLQPHAVVHRGTRWNYRMTNMQAPSGLAHSKTSNQHICAET